MGRIICLIAFFCIWGVCGFPQVYKQRIFHTDSFSLKGIQILKTSDEYYTLIAEKHLFHPDGQSPFEGPPNDGTIFFQINNSFDSLSNFQVQNQSSGTNIVYNRQAIQNGSTCVIPYPIYSGQVIPCSNDPNTGTLQDFPGILKYQNSNATFKYLPQDCNSQSIVTLKLTEKGNVEMMTQSDDSLIFYELNEALSVVNKNLFTVKGAKACDYVYTQDGIEVLIEEGSNLALWNLATNAKIILKDIISDTSGSFRKNRLLKVASDTYFVQTKRRVLKLNSALSIVDSYSVNGSTEAVYIDSNLHITISYSTRYPVEYFITEFDSEGNRLFTTPMAQGLEIYDIYKSKNDYFLVGSICSSETPKDKPDDFVIIRTNNIASLSTGISEKKSNYLSYNGRYICIQDIALLDRKSTTLTITDINGIRIIEWAKPFTEPCIDLIALKPGIYIATLTDDRHSHSIKILK